MKGDNILLKNIGFPGDFFDSMDKVYLIKKSAFRKIYSDNAVERIPIEEGIPRQCKEAEDKELYQEDEAEYIPEEAKDHSIEGLTYFNEEDSEQAKTLASSSEQIHHLNQLLKQMSSSYEEKQVIKAYRSRHKSKFYQIYELNSVQSKENNKYRLFHKCNYPHCGRTFASAGWLKSHFADHLKVINDNKFNILFEKYIKSKEIKVFE